MWSETIWVFDSKNRLNKFVPEDEANDFKNKLTYLLENYIEGFEGVFTFPDGTSMLCKRKVPYVYTKVGD